MSTERTKHYLDHLYAYMEMNDDEREEYMDGAGGDLLDNIWYAMTDEEHAHCTKAITEAKCKKYGHDESVTSVLTYNCVCGSKKPYKIKL